jgi:hypothetical protein
MTAHILRHSLPASLPMLALADPAIASLALAQDTRHLQQVHRLAAVVLTAAADAPIHADPDRVGSAQGHQHARRQIYDETERTIAKEWAPGPIGECPRNTAGTAYEPEGDAAEPVREDD